MFSAITSLTAAFVVGSTTAQMAPIEVPADEYRPKVGTQLIFDTEENLGYMLNPDGQYWRFKVATGQRRSIYYIGRYYYAATPNWDWEIQTVEKKARSITYGEGRFLRMFKDGDYRTAYGVHSARNDEEIMAKETKERFYSAGCPTVLEEDLDVIVRAVNLNEGTLKVKTRKGDALNKVLEEMKTS